MLQGIAFALLLVFASSMGLGISGLVVMLIPSWHDVGRRVVSFATAGLVSACVASLGLAAVVWLL